MLSSEQFKTHAIRAGIGVTIAGGLMALGSPQPGDYQQPQGWGKIPAGTVSIFDQGHR
jgi:hypothetical protein